MKNSNTRLEQGGFTSAPADNAIALVASDYSHPALPGRCVVRLVPAPLTEAEDLTLSIIGLQPQERTEVGFTQHRAAGFPAWAVMNDPDNADKALELVEDLQGIARLAKTKPGNAKKKIADLEAQLETAAPQFLPTFFEEAGRGFIAAENPKAAAQMFSKGREAERRHGLAIDEERHNDVLMEFAYAGAISAKELSAEAKSLSERTEPSEAYERFRTLCLRSIKNGLAPYSSMKKDLGKLAKSAGLDPAQEDVNVVSELLNAAAIERAPTHFWRNYGAASKKAIEQDGSLMERLLRLVPTKCEVNVWLQLLRKVGALEVVKDGRHPDVVQRLVRHTARNEWLWESEPTQLAPVLEEILPSAGCASVEVQSFAAGNVPLAAYEQLAANDVAVVFTGDRSEPRFDLIAWARSEDRAPLPHLVANSELRKMLIDAIPSRGSWTETLDIIAADPHLQPLVIELLTAKLNEVGSDSGAQDRLEEVKKFAKAFSDVSDAEVQDLVHQIHHFNPNSGGDTTAQSEYVDHGIPAEQLSGTPTLRRHKDAVASVVYLEGDNIDGMNIWRAASVLDLHDRPVPDVDELEKLNNAWVDLLGHADALLALAAQPGRTVEDVQALKELWIVLRDCGLLAATHLTVDEVEITYASGFKLELPPRVVARDYHFTTLLRADGGGDFAVDGGTFKVVSSKKISASRTDLEPVFDDILKRVKAEGPQPWSAAVGEAFANASGASLAESHLVMAGFPNFRAFDSNTSNYLPKEVRKAMGLKVDEAKAVRDRIEPFFEHLIPVLAAGVPEDATRLVSTGLDVEAMAAYWRAHGPKPSVTLPDTVAKHIPKLFDDDVVGRVYSGERESESWSAEVTAALWLAGELDLTDPMREELADHLERLSAAPTAIDNVSLGDVSFHEYIFESIGLGTGEGNAQKQVGRFRIEPEGMEEVLKVDLSGVKDQDDPDLALAKELSVRFHGDLRTVEAVNLNLRGVLSGYAQWLRNAGSGSPHDPLAAASDLVALVSDELKLSESGARYYLQLLALPDPTDRNVRRWNGWKKADITSAGSELVDAGVAIEAKRSRSGRSFFLPGGWTEAYSPHLPVETSKVDPFGMVTLKNRSKAEPMLQFPIAPLPPPEWFQRSWELREARKTTE